MLLCAPGENPRTRSGARADLQVCPHTTLLPHKNRCLLREHRSNLHQSCGAPSLHTLSMLWLDSQRTFLTCMLCGAPEPRAPRLRTCALRMPRCRTCTARCGSHPAARSNAACAPRGARRRRRDARGQRLQLGSVLAGQSLAEMRSPSSKTAHRRVRSVLPANIFFSIIAGLALQG